MFSLIIILKNFLRELSTSCTEIWTIPNEKLHTKVLTKIQNVHSFVLMLHQEVSILKMLIG